MKRLLVSLALGVCLSACGSSSSPVVATPTPTPTRVAVQAGCYSSLYQGVDRARLGCGLLTSFGSASFDRAFAAESVRLDTFYGVPTPVVAFDECSGVRNALS